MRDLERLDDPDLAALALRLERQLDQLDDACWPAAHRERSEIRDRLAAVRAEAERRRT